MENEDTGVSGLRAGPTVANVLVFAFLLHAAWIGAWLLERFLEPHLLWMTTSGGRSVYWLSMKILLWIIPSVVLIRWSGRSFRDVAGLDRAYSVLAWGGGVGMLLGAITVLTKLFSGQSLFASPLGWTVFSGVLVAPIVEEITFRGAILGALEKHLRFGIANLITGILFLGIHLPGWYFQGCLWRNLATPVGGALSIFLLGLLFGYVAHKSRSVAGSTLCHVVNNLFNA